MTDLFNSKVTIYNSISADDGKTRLFYRFVIDKCHIFGQMVDKASDTIRKVVNSQNVITKDTEHYKSPLEFAGLAPAERENYFTAQTGDFVVLGEVADEVTNAQEFAQLQTKYKNNGFKVMSVAENLNGMAIDNIMITNV